MKPQIKKTPKPMHECPTCELKFNTEYSLRKHEDLYCKITTEEEGLRYLLHRQRMRIGKMDENDENTSQKSELDLKNVYGQYIDVLTSEFDQLIDDREVDNELHKYESIAQNENQLRYDQSDDKQPMAQFEFDQMSDENIKNDILEQKEESLEHLQNSIDNDISPSKKSTSGYESLEQDDAEEHLSQNIKIKGQLEDDFDIDFDQDIDHEDDEYIEDDFEENDGEEYFEKEGYDEEHEEDLQEEVYDNIEEVEEEMENEEDIESQQDEIEERSFYPKGTEDPPTTIDTPSEFNSDMVFDNINYNEKRKKPHLSSTMRHSLKQRRRERKLKRLSPAKFSNTTQTQMQLNSLEMLNNAHPLSQTTPIMNPVYKQKPRPALTPPPIPTHSFYQSPNYQPIKESDVQYSNFMSQPFMYQQHRYAMMYTPPPPQPMVMMDPQAYGTLLNRLNLLENKLNNLST